MNAPSVRRVPPGELLGHQADLEQVYTEAFAGPPWYEDAGRASDFVRRLSDDVSRPGFVAALGFDGDGVIGLATAWTTPSVFPANRCYPEIAAALGTDCTMRWLCGSREVDELALAGAARGRGTGAALLEAVTADAPEGRCWLLTSVRARQALGLYRRLGWAQATHPAPGGTGLVVFLGPAHPDRAAVPLPL
ncbi:GNAT family N-acetyltransferase [Streptomyces sp. NPDC094448]|uniref:GNAT family N-acetyltransferase n=1 Tax=Streptomyces sp. NPDC094448 TaxID=3366063 RepID=UPI00381C9DE9